MRNFFGNCLRGSAVRICALTFATLLLPAASFKGNGAFAQRVTARTVDGTVTEKSGAAVKGAVVHLKDTRTLSQRSYITAEDGRFHFTQLSSGSDYELWAEVEGKKSSVKGISSFDTKNAFTISLKIDN